MSTRYFSLLAINNSYIKAAALGPMGFGNVYTALHFILGNKIRFFTFVCSSRTVGCFAVELSLRSLRP